jgi:hypothetical protein
VAARLDDRFRLLTGGRRTALRRQQTLAATLDWSHDLLTEAEWALLRRLTVFAGVWTLEAAEAVGSGDGVEAWEVVDLLAHLVDKSLVVAEERDGAARYRLLETVRQYAGDRLLAAGEAEAARDRRRDWYLAQAERAAPALRGPEVGAWLDRLAAEHDNLRAALAWCLAAPTGPRPGCGWPGRCGCSGSRATSWAKGSAGWSGRWRGGARRRPHRAPRRWRGPPASRGARRHTTGRRRGARSCWRCAGTWASGARRGLPHGRRRPAAGAARRPPHPGAARGSVREYVSKAGKSSWQIYYWAPQPDGTLKKKRETHPT